MIRIGKNVEEMLTIVMNININGSSIGGIKNTNGALSVPRMLV